MDLQTFLDDTTQELQKTHAALTNATTPAEYAQAAYDHFEALRSLANMANEGGTQIDEFPSVP